VRKSSGKRRKNCGGNVSGTHEAYQGALHGVLKREFGCRRNAAKVLAKLAGGVSPRTAENWLSGACAPQGQALLSLMANNEAVDAEMERLKALLRRGDR
jgi:hypothetical protein